MIFVSLKKTKIHFYFKQCRFKIGPLGCKAWKDPAPPHFSVFICVTPYLNHCHLAVLASYFLLQAFKFLSTMGSELPPPSTPIPQNILPGEIFITQTSAQTWLLSTFPPGYLFNQRCLFTLYYLNLFCLLHCWYNY